jgi:hypothetical protein
MEYGQQESGNVSQTAERSHPEAATAQSRVLQRKSTTQPQLPVNEHFFYYYYYSSGGVRPHLFALRLLEGTLYQP